MSATSVRTAGTLPSVRSTLVAPMVPLPARRMSKLPKARATRNPMGMAPIRYAAASPASVISRPTLAVLDQRLRPRPQQEAIEVVGAGQHGQAECHPQDRGGKQVKPGKIIRHAFL